MEHLPPTPSSAPNAISFCQFRGISVMCGPRGLKGEPDHLFHNNGDGTFTDVSKQAGVADEGHSRYGFTSVFVDMDNDGKVDLLVANDSTPNYLYINKGDGTFKDFSIPSGFALNQDGQEVANMGMAIGDYRNNGPKSERGCKLTPREIEILQLIVDGKSTKEIAAQLRLSENTVGAPRANIMRGLGVRRTAEVVVYAIRNRLVNIS
jgi:DNA-binding CsgD family transcriptional regulator